MRLLLVPLLVAATVATAFAQVSTNAVDGLRSKTVRLIAYVNCTVVPEPGKEIKNATIIVRDDRIINVGTAISIPDAAHVRDLKGAWVYAGFIDPFVDKNGLDKGAQGRMDRTPRDGDDEGPSTPPQKGAHHWNQAVHPETLVTDDLRIDDKSVEPWYELGYTTAGISVHDGIFSGNVAGIVLKPGSASEVTLHPNAAQRIDFRKGTSKTPYPSSLMGSIALIRQTLMDAEWYGQVIGKQNTPGTERPAYNISLDVLSTALNNKQPFIVRAYDEHDVLRWKQIADECDISLIIRGSGLEFRRKESIAPFHPDFILPLDMPKVPDVSDPTDARQVSLVDLINWYWAPSNPAFMDSIGCRIAFTLDGMKDRSRMLAALRKLFDRGLSKDKILAAMTTVPASYLGIDQQVGRIAPNMLANMVVMSGPLLDEGTMVRSVVVAGHQTDIAPPADIDMRGTWSLTMQGFPSMKVKITGTAEHPQASFRADSITLTSTFRIQHAVASFTLQTDTLRMAGMARGSGRVDSILVNGTVIKADGNEVPFVMRRDSAFDERLQPKVFTIPTIRPLPSMLPLGPFGFDSVPPQAEIVLKNATVWTCGPQGIIENADVVISGGKISAVGLGLSATNTFDATGMHITPGIIDEHSHIAIARGVNEGTHAVTTEVRIGDVVDPDDVNIYRQLAGGVTGSHLLHGSANPMGGQLQFIKMRWGADAEGLKVQGAKPTVKFALGENVKQSNWGDRFTTRYPQTRMGVEEIMRDAFQTAREYEAKRSKVGIGAPVRRDLQMDALVEIMNGQRNIHCHSYKQSEILMLMRLAEEFNFRVHTFTHILEGYKVAEEMAAHGAMASSFSDWWAYKFEVYDAIPQNPAIMHEQGVVVSINSDDAEMARRLNQEAGKSVSYGGVGEEEALKFVTINAAKQMAVDDLTGSLEPGKWADVVVWSGNPLSSASRVERTYVEGRLFFSREQDKQLAERDAALRHELEQLALREKNGGAPSQKVNSKMRREYHCDDIEDEMTGCD